MSAVTIAPCDPSSPEAAAMSAALWVEVQARYGFTAPDPFDPAAFAAPRGGFWLATDAASDVPVGSVALAPIDDLQAELDVMYVAPSHRRRGVAQGLLGALEQHARETGFREVLLRAGDPQPEALAFYRSAGFGPAERFGRWVEDDTALCFVKHLA